jgi:hypothetical protein
MVSVGQPSITVIIIFKCSDSFNKQENCQEQPSWLNKRKMVSVGQPSYFPQRLQQQHVQVRTTLVVLSSGQNSPIPEALVKEGRGERFYTVFMCCNKQETKSM